MELREQWHSQVELGNERVANARHARNALIHECTARQRSLHRGAVTAWRLEPPLALRPSYTPRRAFAQRESPPPTAARLTKFLEFAQAIMRKLYIAQTLYLYFRAVFGIISP
jgi:hypothetical protein